MTLTVQLPEGVNHKDIILLKDDKPVKPSDRIKIVQTSPTTIEIQIIKAKPDDQGEYSIVADEKEQPLMQLKVVPKPVTRQTMDLPQTTFDEGQTLTIKCQFDSKPEETFEILHNGRPLVNDDRIVTIVEETTYTIIVKNLRPKEDEGVYTLASPHLIIDTPSITVLPRKEDEKPKDVETMVEEIEEETIVIQPAKKPEKAEIEIVEQGEETVSNIPAVFANTNCSNTDVRSSLNDRFFRSYLK